MVAAAVVVISVFSTLVYCGFFYGSISEYKAEKNITHAVDNYYLKPTYENAKKIINLYERCNELVHEQACKSIVKENSKLITQLIQHGHIDQLLDAEIFSTEEFSYGLGDVWAKYSGNHWAGLIKKAEALSRQANYMDALLLYKTLFKNKKEQYVARRIQQILEYFGCTDDMAIWSEYASPNVDYHTPTVNPGPNNYPSQPSKLTPDEIADQRVRLRKGEFIDFTESCPINKFIK